MTTQTTLLPATAGADVSADITLEAGAILKVAVFHTDPLKLVLANASIQQKAPGAVYVPVTGGVLNSGQYAVMLQGPGTYRVSRAAGSVVGVFTEQ